MVVKVIGRTSDLEIVFTHIEGDNWKSEVPRNTLGQYYLDLYAIDEAGNEAFMSKALFEVDPFSLCCNITLFESDNDVNIKKSNYEFIYVNDGYEFKCKEVRCI